MNTLDILVKISYLNLKIKRENSNRKMSEKVKTKINFSPSDWNMFSVTTSNYSTQAISIFIKMIQLENAGYFQTRATNSCLIGCPNVMSLRLNRQFIHRYYQKYRL